MKLLNNSIQDFINLISNGFNKICTKIYACMVCIGYTIMSSFNFLICTVQQGMVAKSVHKYLYNIFFRWNSSTSTSLKHLQHSTEVFFYLCSKCVSIKSGHNHVLSSKKIKYISLGYILVSRSSIKPDQNFSSTRLISNGSLAFRDLADNLLYLVRIYLCT